jgi:hypothetical protein
MNPLVRIASGRACKEEQEPAAFSDTCSSRSSRIVRTAAGHLSRITGGAHQPSFRLISPDEARGCCVDASRSSRRPQDMGRPNRECVIGPSESKTRTVLSPSGKTPPESGQFRHSDQRNAWQCSVVTQTRLAQRVLFACAHASDPVRRRAADGPTAHTAWNSCRRYAQDGSFERTRCLDAALRLDRTRRVEAGFVYDCGFGATPRLSRAHAT